MRVSSCSSRCVHDAGNVRRSLVPTDGVLLISFDENARGSRVRGNEQRMVQMLIVGRFQDELNSLEGRALCTSLTPSGQGKLSFAPKDPQIPAFRRLMVHNFAAGSSLKFGWIPLHAYLPRLLISCNYYYNHSLYSLPIRCEEGRSLLGIQVFNEAPLTWVVPRGRRGVPLLSLLRNRLASLFI